MAVGRPLAALLVTLVVSCGDDGGPDDGPVDSGAPESIDAAAPLGVVGDACDANDECADDLCVAEAPAPFCSIACTPPRGAECPDEFMCRTWYLDRWLCVPAF